MSSLITKILSYSRTDYPMGESLWISEYNIMHRMCYDPVIDDCDYAGDRRSELTIIEYPCYYIVYAKNGYFKGEVGHGKLRRRISYTELETLIEEYFEYVLKNRRFFRYRGSKLVYDLVTNKDFLRKRALKLL